MYVDYIFLTECDLTAEEMKKNLSYMFSQLEDLFEENGASVLVSSEGSPRKNYCCRVVEKIPTADPDKHNTVARSRKPGIIRDKTVLQPEYADIYVYDPSLEAEKTNDSKNEEVKKTKFASIMDIAKKGIRQDLHKSFETFATGTNVDLEKADKEQADALVSRFQEIFKDSIGDIKPLAPQQVRKNDEAVLSGLKRVKV